MKVKLLHVLRGLLRYWLVNLVLVGTSMLLILFIDMPTVSLITTKKLLFPPSIDMIFKTISFAFIAAFLTGTSLWIKEEVFGNHD